MKFFFLFALIVVGSVAMAAADHHIVRSAEPLQLVDLPEIQVHEPAQQNHLRAFSISASPSTVNAGQSVAISYSASTKVWIGFFKSGQSSTSLYQFMSANSGVANFDLPLTSSGAYSVKLIEQGSNIVRASTSVTVNAATSTDCADLPAAVSDTAMLQLHNSRRSARGLPALTWDNTLANYAKNYAEQLRCIFPAGNGLVHSAAGSEYRPAGAGENLAVGYASAAQAIVGWVEDELPFLNIGCTYSCGCPGGCKGCANPSSAVVGHATQSLWRTTTKIGCGKSTTANGRHFYVCTYNPSGNCCGYDYVTGRTC